IWLEPNQRGGYTVKVLDFGIAKVDGHRQYVMPADLSGRIAVPTQAIAGSQTLGGEDAGTAIHDSISPTMLIGAETAAVAPEAPSSESETIIQPIEAENAVEPDAVST